MDRDSNEAQSETWVHVSTDTLNLQSEMEVVWARRAEQLAQAAAQEIEGEQIELALVRLGREVYGLSVQYVFDIRPVEPHSVTRVPRTPEWVAGVVNLRGRILSVIDLHRFLGLPGAPDHSSDNTTESCLIVVQMPDMEVALLADEVLGVEMLPASQVQDAAGVVRGLPPEYVQGIAEWEGVDKQSGFMLVILNLPAMLADNRLIIHEEIT